MKKWGWDWRWSGCWEKGCTSQAAIAQIKAGHVRIIAIIVQFMFVVHHYFKNFVNLLAWPLPKSYRLAAANCGRSWPHGCWLLIRFDFPHQRLQGGLDWAAMDWLTMTTTIKICGRFFACCARGQSCQVCLFSLFEFWQSPSLSETHSLTFDLFVFFLLISPPFFYQI